MLHKIDKALLNKCTKFSAVDEYVLATVFIRNKADLNDLNKYFKVECYEYFEFINALIVRVNKKNIKDLLSFDNVTYVSSVPEVFSLINKSKSFMNLDYFYSKSIYGNGITIAIIDTGVNPILDFCMPTQRIVKFIDFINSKNDAYDDNGHGTFVTSILLGNGLVSNGKYCGIAPKAKVVSLKALDKNGESSALQILKAMQWVFENHEKYKIKVVCMSFGSEPLEKNDPLVLGVEQLWRKGITVVAAAGNSGPDFSTIKSPAISNKIITVGALDDGRNGKIQPAKFSSRGPVGNYFKPDVLAPAVDIIGANSSLINGKGYTTMSGTSVAAPMIAGVCALIYECYPKISPDQVKKFICRNAVQLTYKKNIEGYGMFKVIL